MVSPRVCAVVEVGRDVLAVPSPSRKGTRIPLLPPIGAEIPCSSLAINTPLKIRTALVTVDFRGGFKQRVDVNPDDPINSVRMRMVGLKFSAELPDGDEGAKRTITIEQNDVDADAPSRLRVIQAFPPRFEHMIIANLTMAIEQSEGEPLILTTKDPARLIGKLTQYPPKGDLYQLQEPVDLVLPDDPDTVIATIEKFPAKVGGL
ncbi:hypothetical protein ACFWAA_10855 [Streptomyces sp. NPDC059922]|uniref:hypothetical protein n=1 Tax=Streptomyces sp. NPDC059922 TaxID=3347005 RepID=UPI003660DFD6